MQNKPLPEWDELLSAVARLQTIIPDTTLVGGTAAAIYAQHRRSADADHILPDLATRFDSILGELESVAGWKTSRIQKPVQILGSLDGIETGIRQLIRTSPLETQKIQHGAFTITVPTEQEILRIKAILVLKRNATRDYIDLAALSEHLGMQQACIAMKKFDTLYPQESGESALMQLQVQLADPRPYDFGSIDLSEYKGIAAPWDEWSAVQRQCRNFSVELFQVHRERNRENYL